MYHQVKKNQKYESFIHKPFFIKTHKNKKIIKKPKTAIKADKLISVS